MSICIYAIVSALPCSYAKNIITLIQYDKIYGLVNYANAILVHTFFYTMHMKI